jgi:hypothetical protein
VPCLQVRGPQRARPSREIHATPPQAAFSADSKTRPSVLRRGPGCSPLRPDRLPFCDDATLGAPLLHGPHAARENRRSFLPRPTGCAESRRNAWESPPTRSMGVTALLSADRRNWRTASTPTSLRVRRSRNGNRSPPARRGRALLNRGCLVGSAHTRGKDQPVAREGRPVTFLQRVRDIRATRPRPAPR